MSQLRPSSRHRPNLSCASFAICSPLESTLETIPACRKVAQCESINLTTIAPAEEVPDNHASFIFINSGISFAKNRPSVEAFASAYFPLGHKTRYHSFCARDALIDDPVQSAREVPQIISATLARSLNRAMPRAQPAVMTGSCASAGVNVAVVRQAPCPPAQMPVQLVFRCASLLDLAFQGSFLTVMHDRHFSHNWRQGTVGDRR
jgi:hypothetical protein